MQIIILLEIFFYLLPLFPCYNLSPPPCVYFPTYTLAFLASATSVCCPLFAFFYSFFSLLDFDGRQFLAVTLTIFIADDGGE